jgi:hypothetical protein
MHLYMPDNHNAEFETLSKAEVLAEIEPLVEDLMAQHLEKRRLWMPSDFLPADEQMDEDDDRRLTKLRDRARGLMDSVRVAVVLNMLTEEGLPHFHRLLSKYRLSRGRLHTRMGQGSVSCFRLHDAPGTCYAVLTSEHG